MKVYVIEVKSRLGWKIYGIGPIVEAYPRRRDAEKRRAGAIKFNRDNGLKWEFRVMPYVSTAIRRLR